MLHGLCWVFYFSLLCSVFVDMYNWNNMCGIYMQYCVQKNKWISKTLNCVYFFANGQVINSFPLRRCSNEVPLFALSRSYSVQTQMLNWVLLLLEQTRVNNAWQMLNANRILIHVSFISFRVFVVHPFFAASSMHKVITDNNLAHSANTTFVYPKHIYKMIHHSAFL